MREAGKLFFEDCGNSCRLSGNEKTNSQYVTSNRSRSSDLFQVNNNVNLSTFSVKYVRDKLCDTVLSMSAAGLQHEQPN